MGWNHQLGFLELTSTSLVPDDGFTIPREKPLSRIISHRIHGTGIMLTYIYHKKIMKKINHPWIGVYTVRPMEILWVLRLSSIEHDGVLYDNAMDLSTGLRWDSFQAIGRDVPPIPTWAPYGKSLVLALYYVGIYGLLSLRIHTEHNTFHGYSVRGTPNCPLNLWCWDVKMLCSILTSAYFFLWKGSFCGQDGNDLLDLAICQEVEITTTMNFVRNNTEFWTHVTYAAFCFQVSRFPVLLTKLTTGDGLTKLTTGDGEPSRIYKTMYSRLMGWTIGIVQWHFKNPAKHQLSCLSCESLWNEIGMSNKCRSCMNDLSMKGIVQCFSPIVNDLTFQGTTTPFLLIWDTWRVNWGGMIPCIPIWMTMSTLHINQSSCGVKISYLVPCNGIFLIGGEGLHIF